MKLKKLNLHELADAELNEREMCRILGGGEPGCCQCGCNYADSGGSSTSSNDSANNAKGFTSDPGADPCPKTEETPTTTRPTQVIKCGEDGIWPQESTCLSTTITPPDPVMTTTI